MRCGVRQGKQPACCLPGRTDSPVPNGCLRTRVLASGHGGHDRWRPRKRSVRSWRTRGLPSSYEDLSLQLRGQEFGSRTGPLRARQISRSIDVPKLRTPLRCNTSEPGLARSPTDDRDQRPSRDLPQSLIGSQETAILTGSDASHRGNLLACRARSSGATESSGKARTGQFRD